PMYALKEIALITVAAAFVMGVRPEYFWQIGGLVIAGYGLLCFLSAWAFRGAVDSGLVRESRNIEGERRAFFIAPGCPSRWLVKRHIRM
ncbi:hypothetical protein Q0P29_14160, partial [Staphylococcus aureus]|nr:hypothetical protein [Staphylococcus aureus]